MQQWPIFPLYFVLVFCFLNSQCLLSSLPRNDCKGNLGFGQTWQLYHAEAAILGAASFVNVLFYEGRLFTQFFVSAVVPLDVVEKPVEYLIQFSVIQLCCPCPPSSPPAWRNVCGTVRNPGHAGTAFPSTSCERGWCGGWKVFIEMLLFIRLLTAACDFVEAECRLNKIWGGK